MPGLYPLWCLLGASAAFLLVSLILQGPGKALRQLADLPGHFRRFAHATTRLRRSTRLVAAIIGFTVFSWTAAQSLTFRQVQGKDDLVLLLRSRGLIELAVEQGMHCALTPFRDLAALGDNLPLLMVAIVLLFRATSEPWDRALRQSSGGADSAHSGGRLRSNTTRVVLLLAIASVYLLYRVVGRLMGSVDLPLGGPLVIGVLLIPVMTLACDGFVLSWVLTELRDSEFAAGQDRERPGNLDAAIDLTPAGMLACLVALPARYVGTTALLLLDHLPPWITSTGIGRYLRWQLGPGLATLQAIGLVFAGVIGVACWNRGSLKGVSKGWIRLMSAEGGNLLAAVVAIGITAAVLASVPYFILLLLPVQTWVLAAADSYSHYATVAVGLWGAAVLVELGRSSLPVAPIAPMAAATRGPLAGRTEPVAF